MATQPARGAKRSARTMFKATPLALAVAVAGTVATGSVALAYYDGPTGEIVGCLSPAGTLRVLDDRQLSCNTLERRLSLNSFGGPASGDLTGNYPNPQLKADAVGQAEIASGAVGSPEIANSAVKSAHLLDLSVTGYDIAPKAIDRSKLGTLAVGYDQLGIDAVRNINIGNDAVGGAEIVDRSVKKPDLADGSVGAGQLGAVSMIVESVQFGEGAGGRRQVIARCAPGQRVLSGGYHMTDTDPDDEPIVVSSRPYATSGSGAPDAWEVIAFLTPIQLELYGGDTALVEAYVMCLTI